MENYLVFSIEQSGLFEWELIKKICRISELPDAMLSYHLVSDFKKCIQGI